MPIERYFLNSALLQNQTQELTGNEFHHMIRVMRTRKGDAVELVNGKGILAHAKVLEIGKEKAILSIDNIHVEPESQKQLILAQALPKQNRLDFILEKGTELGVDVFWLFPGHLSVKKEFYPNQMERAEAVTIAAMKQCGRLTLPKILLQPSLDQWDTLKYRTFFGDLSEGAPRFERIWKEEKSLNPDVMFITGPESGFSSKENDVLKDLGAIGVKLHDNILRTDTASLMALSLMSHWMMAH